MALVDLLAASLNVYDDTDPGWSQYIKDHKTYLLNNSTLYTITPAFLQRYKYSLKQYLGYLNYNTNAAWIVAYINDIPSDVYFTTNVSTLFIPNISILGELLTTYQTILSSKR